MSGERYFDEIQRLMNTVRSENMQSITDAAELVAQTVMNGGIVQAFGSGHSLAGAMEISRRAGGLVPVKCMDEPSRGRYEKVEGVGTEYLKECDLRPCDMMIIVSNSGVNPMPVEFALFAKKMGLKVVAVTAVQASLSMPARHSSGKRLCEIADVVLDIHSAYGDAAMEVQGIPCKVCGTSSVMTDIYLNSVMLEAMELMVSRGFEPPVFLSGNIEGGEEYGKKQIMKYYDRMFRNHTYY